MQAYHLRVNFGVGVPVQVPLLTVNLFPTRAVPEIEGRTVFTARILTVVAVEIASHDTGSVAVLVPVTSTVMYFPACADVNSSVFSVALISLQVPGTVWVALVILAVHVYHWYVNVGVGVPVQVPSLAVKV